jgi:hypothetical protein
MSFFLKLSYFLAYFSQKILFYTPKISNFEYIIIPYFCPFVNHPLLSHTPTQTALEIINNLC